MKMDRYIYSGIVISCFCLGVGLSWAGDADRVFLGMDGRSINGMLIGYNPDDQVATIKRNDDKKFRVSLEIFSETDQQYIRNQGPLMNFMHSIRIVPMLRTFDSAGRYNGTRYKTEQIKCFGYAIIFENLSLTPFDAVEIEYCMFYRQSWRHKERREILNGVQCGYWNLGLLVPGSRHVLETEKVLICDENSVLSIFGGDDSATGGVEGVWLRVVATLPSRDRVSRELQSPPRLGNYHNWETVSIPVGLNIPTSQF